MKTFEDNKKGKLLKCYKDLIKNTSIVNLRQKHRTSWLELEYYCECVGKQNCTMSLLSHDKAVSDSQRDNAFWKFDSGCNKLSERWES